MRLNEIRYSQVFNLPSLLAILFIAVGMPSVHPALHDHLDTHSIHHQHHHEHHHQNTNPTESADDEAHQECSICNFFASTHMQIYGLEPLIVEVQPVICDFLQDEIFWVKSDPTPAEPRAPPA